MLSFFQILKKSCFLPNIDIRHCCLIVKLLANLLFTATRHSIYTINQHEKISI